MIAHIASKRRPIVQAYTRTTERLILALLLIRLLKGLSELLTYSGFPALGAAVTLVYYSTTYMVTAALIWREREHLADFYIGRVAVILFVAGKPLILLAVALSLTPFLGLGDVMPFMILTPISIGLSWKLWRDKRSVLTDRPGLPRWMLLGLSAGSVLGALTGYLILLQSGRSSQLMSLPLVILLPLIQLTNAATYEEPFFRGFLWGLLSQRGWRTGTIWLFQAAVFWLSHIVYIVHFPISFWVIVPLMGLALGLITWRAQDIAPAMLAHGLIDSLPQLINRNW
jgi:membrane protease YdiL (CAAX protease family)